MRRFPILIAGGGASGTLLAAALAECGETNVLVVEPRAELGRGLAYSTTCPAHLLNVPAARMSAFASDPPHFVRWLQSRGDDYGPSSFVPRELYGSYLASVGRDACERGAVHVRDRIASVAFEDGSVVVTLECGLPLRARALVLAMGNAAPARWNGAPEDDDRYFASAWEAGALDPDSTGDPVLLLGTGLTAVDAVLGLRQNGHRGPIVMASRRGLLPHEHRTFDAPPARNPNDPDDWRAAVDALRPETNARWQAMPLADRRRFLRHLMPYWNVHRHRMAPEIASAIAAEIAGGSLRMLAARTGRIEPGATGLRVEMRLRGGDETTSETFARVINCSGPEHDVRKLRDPSIVRLIADGVLAPHPLGIGIEVGDDGALASGRNLGAPAYAIGPLRFGTLIETTAIPEIRTQAAELSQILAKHAVEAGGCSPALREQGALHL